MSASIRTTRVRRRIYCFEKWTFLRARPTARKIWTRVIYRFHEEYEIFLPELSLFLNCHGNPHIYLYHFFLSQPPFFRITVRPEYSFANHYCYYARRSSRKNIIIIRHEPIIRLRSSLGGCPRRHDNNTVFSLNRVTNRNFANRVSITRVIGNFSGANKQFGNIPRNCARIIRAREQCSVRFLPVSNFLNIRGYTEAYFADLENTYFSNGLKQLGRRWVECIELKGDYVEKYKSPLFQNFFLQAKYLSDRPRKRTRFPSNARYRFRKRRDFAEIGNAVERVYWLSFARVRWRNVW